MSGKTGIFNKPVKKVIVGSWTRIPIELPSSPIAIPFERIEFSIPDGLKAGFISKSKDKTFDPAHPTILLGAGYKPGKYRIIARDSLKRTIVGVFSFEVLPPFSDGVTGPSLWFDGTIRGFIRGATFGGGQSGPENIGITANTGEWPVAILLADTADHRYPDDVQAIKDHWRDEAFKMDGNGVRSTAKYYDEVSYHKLKVTGDVFGPAHLPNNWSDYFIERTYIDEKTQQLVYDDIWDPNNVLAQACFTAAEGLFDFSKYRSLVMVMPPTNPGKGVWPQAWGCLAKTSQGDFSYAVLVMPRGNLTDTPHKTLAHELGHNLGLPDLYRPQYPPNSTGESDWQNLGHWDLMHWEQNLPQMSAMSRMAEQWLTSEYIKCFNYANQNPIPPVSQDITLYPIEKLPGPNCYSAIEIRLAAGHNYYVEYRVPQPDQTSDQWLPSPKNILVTDATNPSPNESLPYDRPRVMLIHKDSDGDGPVLDKNQGFNETDITSPAHNPFVIYVNDLDGTKANVSIRYGPVGRPDPSIRPWPASADRQYQSPDIEVSNPRSQAYPDMWANMPWAGNDNTVFARVYNGGTLNAPKVAVNFYVQPYDANGYPVGTPNFIGSDIKDIAAGQTVTFSTVWRPPNVEGHFCIMVDIPPYSAPGTPPVIEWSDRNNFAQSNYTTFISESGSPYSREMVSVGVSNPLPYRTGVYILPRQTHPHYRVYLEHTYLTLDPGERREIVIMFEYMPPANEAMGKEWYNIRNHISVSSFIIPRELPGHKSSLLLENVDTPSHLGGIDIDVHAGQGTHFESFDAQGEGEKFIAKGKIVTKGNGNPVPNGKVLLVYEPDWREGGKTERLPSRKQYKTVLLQNGLFATSVQKGGMLWAYYGGTPGYGECTSQKLKLPL